MDRLTPELHLISTFDGDTTGAWAVETRELDFNLARRTVVVVNRVHSIIHLWPDTTTGLEILGAGVQELDLDPDNTALQFDDDDDDVEVDSSRILRHFKGHKFDTAAGTGIHGVVDLLTKDWSHTPITERPMSTTNLRHHFGTEATVSCGYHTELYVDYFIFELRLAELGQLTATRR